MTIVAKLDELQRTANGTLEGVSYLVNDRMNRREANRNRGRECREKAVLDNAETQRAARDVQTALKRVAADPNVKAGMRGAVAAACRRVCSRFAPLTSAKKNGQTYLPLLKRDGEPLKPETLARYYRKEYPTKRGKK